MLHLLLPLLAVLVGPPLFMENLLHSRLVRCSHVIPALSFVVLSFACAGELPVGAGTGISGGSIPLAQTLRARLKPPSSTAMPPSAMPAPPTTVPVMAAPPTSTASNLISIPPSPALKDEPDYDPDYIAKVERVLSSASITNWNKNLVTERGEEETEEPDEKIYMKVCASSLSCWYVST